MTWIESETKIYVAYISSVGSNISPRLTASVIIYLYISQVIYYTIRE